MHPPSHITLTILSIILLPLTNAFDQPFNALTARWPSISQPSSYSSSSLSMTPSYPSNSTATTSIIRTSTSTATAIHTGTDAGFSNTTVPTRATYTTAPRSISGGPGSDSFTSPSPSPSSWTSTTKLTTSSTAETGTGTSTMMTAPSLISPATVITTASSSSSTAISSVEPYTGAADKISSFSSRLILLVAVGWLGLGFMIGRGGG